ncbi:zinc transporter ZIP9 isoform X3 [Centroberyx affinis]|uniref:zinc transporter ZIP9 isoform X3 n=1 Tax=Centroberyx affinis TaxID=166261 RepID=UPI003A5B9D10
MDGGIAITCISVAMFVGCFILGFIPLLFSLSEVRLRFVTILGAGLLCGTALAIIIPEGVDLLEKSWGDPQTGLRSSTSITATLGLIIHAAADGFALGAAVATSEVTVQVIVFLAVILHKAPAAFGLVSFLMHAGVEKKHIQGHLLAFSAAAPILAITTYFILHASSSSHQNQFCMTGVGMLFSAGTFLYVATVHVLPEVSSRGQQHSPPLHTGAGAYQRGRLGVLESLTLVLGAGLPVLLALGLNDD